MHTLLDLRGSIPTFVGLTSGAVHDVNFLDVVPLEEESVVTMDRGYLDFERLYAVHRLPAFFVIRAKRNLRFRRLSSSPVDKTCGVRVDQIIALMGTKSRQDYPESLRRVAFYDGENHRRLVFLTNLFTVSPKTVADIYKQRWKVELFFKWDQGASADQVLLRHFGQRREDPGLGGHHRLPSRRHCKETPEIATKSPYATSNRGSEPVRENRYHSAGYEGIKARNHGRNR
jgi:hypothetical protein